MDFADACLLEVFEANEHGVIVTTDTRDFSAYRVPFVSPLGFFAVPRSVP